MFRYAVIFADRVHSYIHADSLKEAQDALTYHQLGYNPNAYLFLEVNKESKQEELEFEDEDEDLIKLKKELNND